MTLVLLLAFLSFVEGSIKSFGITTGVNPSVASVELRLYWGNNVYECNVVPNQASSQYSCFTDNSSTLLISSNSQQQYSMQITNNHQDAVWIDTIFVTDHTNNIYTIDDFCITEPLFYPLNLIYSKISSVNQCNIFTDQSGTESLSEIAIDTDEHMLTVINVYFRENILEYPNIINSGYVTTSSVQKFGFMTSSDG